MTKEEKALEIAEAEGWSPANDTDYLKLGSKLEKKCDLIDFYSSEKELESILHSKIIEFGETKEFSGVLVDRSNKSKGLIFIKIIKNDSKEVFFNTLIDAVHFVLTNKDK
jgi:hypothetical protein